MLDKTLAIILAGGIGSRLHPLTNDRAKPAVPFGGKYRIIDFTLANCLHSDIRRVLVLTQYKSHSLQKHLRDGWSIFNPELGEYITPVPPQMRVDGGWYSGTANAIYQNLYMIERSDADWVLILSGDHIYRMDLQQMVQYHRRCEADVTVSALPVPIHEAHDFGIMATDPHGCIREFQEKPAHPTPMPGRADHAFASMGNYLFNTEVLMEGLRAAKRRGETDFGHHVLPSLIHTHNLFAYDFSSNRVPGIKPYEEPVYWRDVGNIDAYFEAHKDVLGLEPKFDAFNPQWPIYSSNYQGPVARVIGGDIRNTLLGAATVVSDGVRIRNSIIRREAVIEEDVELEDCIVMDYVRIGRGSRLRRVIVDRHNHIQPGSRIGFDPAEDHRRFSVSPGGVVVVPIGKIHYYARDSRGGAGPGYAE